MTEKTISSKSDDLTFKINKKKFFKFSINNSWIIELEKVNQRRNVFSENTVLSLVVNRNFKNEVVLRYLLILRQFMKIDKNDSLIWTYISICIGRVETCD